MSGPRHHPRNDPSVSCAAASPPVGVPVTVQPDSRPTNVTVPSFPLFHPPLPPQRTVKPVGGAKEDVELAGIAVGSTVGTRHHPRRVVLEHKPLVCKPPPPVDAAAAGAVAILKVPSLNPVLGGGGGAPPAGWGREWEGTRRGGEGTQFNSMGRGGHYQQAGHACATVRHEGGRWVPLMASAQSADVSPAQRRQRGRLAAGRRRVPTATNHPPPPTPATAVSHPAVPVHEPQSPPLPSASLNNRQRFAAESRPASTGRQRT